MTAELKNYLTATADLMNFVLDLVEQEDPAALLCVTSIMESGGMMAVRGAFTSGTGLGMVNIDVIAPDGKSFTLKTFETESKT